MISRCPGFLFIACAVCMTVASKPAASFAGELTTPKNAVAQISPKAPQFAQAPSQDAGQTELTIGAQGPQVSKLQKTLKLLGYFDGEITGIYEQSTAEAVSKFQKATSLPEAKLAKADEPQKSENAPGWMIPGAIGGALLMGGVGLLAWRRRKPVDRPTQPEQPLPDALVESSEELHDRPSESPVDHSENGVSDSAALKGHSNSNGHGHTTVTVSETLPQHTEPPMSYVTETPKVSETTRLAKINIVDELIRDLRTPDPAKRQKVIWELGQRGDTRAVQPMVDLMLDSDSKQRSLILSALSEIGTRTLKPLSRALAISLQDENADVRKNAIRDLTRVYDMVAQISHLLHKATDDPDQEVQETARWALGQLNRIRTVPGMESLPALKNSVSPPESLP
ncbi:HEAT repeat domain-containing protein [Phormidesmis sp. 146-33]